MLENESKMKGRTRKRAPLSLLRLHSMKAPVLRFQMLLLLVYGIAGAIVESLTSYPAAAASSTRIFQAPAPSPQQSSSFSTDPSELAALRVTPASSWAPFRATDPCKEPTWPGIVCTDPSQSGFYHIARIHLSRDTPQALSVLLSVASQLKYLQSLQIQHTTSPNFTFSASIPDSLGQLQQLQQLDLSDNGHYLAGGLPIQLGNLTGLRWLGLAGNQLTGPIPDTICLLASLETLDLGRNQLRSSIPTCIRSLSSLTKLDLGSNRLTSRIPVQLGQISGLVHLNLENNRLQGQFHDSLLALTLLETLRCGKNQLQGPLPSDIGQLQSLQVLDFSFNSDINGSIPSSIGEMSNLVELRLFSMGLRGTIPSNLGKLGNLTKLLLQSNFIKGTIPDSLSGLSNLELLQLQGNKLSGPLPATVFRSLLKLRGLYLQSNAFTGTLPVEITRISTLSVLNLAFNQLEGELPIGLGSMTNLEWLLLGSNRFSGNIPSSIGNLRNLQLLDLSNNLLDGSVPSTIVDMATLQHDLQFNRLSSAALLRNICFQGPCSSTSDSDTASDSFMINAGGPEYNSSDGLFFQPDNIYANASVGFFLANPTCSPTSASWAVSVSGSSGSSKLISTTSPINVTGVGIDPGFVAANQNLYKTARLGGDSLAYYGRCMKPGKYNVQLHFVELQDLLVDSPGRRVFDVLIQDQLVHERLDILSYTGSAFVPLVIEYEAEVGADSSTLKLELRGTGSWNTSRDTDLESYNGPIITALRVFPNATSNSGSGLSKSRQLWAILGASIGVLAVVCTGLFVGLACWLRQAEKRARLSATGHEEADDGHGILPDHHHFSFADSQIGCLVSFEYSDLVAATDKFSSDNLLGQGAYGKVYKGVLQDGKSVAIKQLVHRTPTCKKWFHHELQVISSVRHRNLVPLIGCCIDRGFPLLVCEYMPNGNLHSALFTKDSGVFLTWELRCRIALDVARGLHYLHEDCANVKIIHRDVKPGNILLDQEMRAHISDFGLAKLMDHDQEPELVVSSVMGTRGYLAPEYVLHGQLSEKVDVYSYGIVILELISGRRGMQSSVNVSSPEPVSIDEWAWEALSSDRVPALADPRLESCGYPLDEMVKMVQIAMWCTQGLPEMRPSMAQVVQMLSGQARVPELPSERVSWEDFKDIMASGSYTMCGSSIWESMNGAGSSMSGYLTANAATLPDPKTHEEQEQKKQQQQQQQQHQRHHYQRSFDVVAPPPSSVSVLSGEAGPGL